MRECSTLQQILCLELEFFCLFDFFFFFLFNKDTLKKKMLFPDKHSNFKVVNATSFPNLIINVMDLTFFFLQNFGAC